MKIKDLISPYREIVEFEVKEQNTPYIDIIGFTGNINDDFIWCNSRINKGGDDYFLEDLEMGKYPPITPEIKSLYPELKEVFDRCDLPDLGTPEKPFNEVLEQTLKVKDLRVYDLDGKQINNLSESIKQSMLKPNWKWHLTSITNNSGTTQTQFKMSDFGEPYEIEKINDTRYKFKLPTNDGWVLGFGVKIFVE